MAAVSASASVVSAAKGSKQAASLLALGPGQIRVRPGAAGSHVPAIPSSLSSALRLLPVARNTSNPALHRAQCGVCRAQSGGEQASSSSRTRVTGRGCRVTGTGSAVPAMAVTNEYLSKIVDTNDEWIATRTGIRTRRVLSGHERMTELAVEASQRALASAGVEAQDVDLILMCTSSPDDIFGGACLVQRELGCSGAVAFDITAACSGFVLGLVTASRFISGGGYENVLVVGADALSRYVDWTDRGTCILFGDGCGAVLVQAAGVGEESALLGFDMRSDGHGAKHLNASMGCSAPLQVPLQIPDQGHSDPGNGRAPGSHPAAAGGALGVDQGPAAAAAVAVGGSPLAVAVAEREGEEATGSAAGFSSRESANGAGAAAHEVQLPGRAQPHFISMNGREVYKFAVTAVPQILESAMGEAGIGPEDVDWLLLHQANQRILDAVAQKMGLPTSKVISNVASYGNTSAASIPLALDEAVRSGKVKPGDVLAMAGFGAGLTWAGAILRYG